MRLFNNDKKEEINELVIQTGNNTSEIIALRRDNETTKKELELYKIETEERYKLLLEKIQALETERIQIDAETLENTAKNSKDNYTFDEICPILKVKNLNTSTLKYYLHENGLMNLKINPNKNHFSLNLDNLNHVGQDLLNCIDINDNKISFKPEFIDYIKSKYQEVLSSIVRYNRKQEQYKISKKNLESRNITNYKEEIKAICGTDSNEKWNAIYKIFSNTYKNFYNEYEKYKTENHVDGRYDISRVAYVVSVMGEGNYLLKIACDLYA